MIPVAALVGFAIAVMPLVITPGASFTLVSARGIAGDRRGAWATIAGTAAGIITHAMLAGVGLAAVVMRSAELYRALRIVGALYLIGLGVVLLWRSRRASEVVSEAPRANRESVGTQGWRAYVANVLNGKAASVYLTLAPQFLPADRVGVGAMALLGLVHITVMTVWLGFWSTGLTVAASWFDAGRWKRRVDALGGGVLVVLGLRSAAEVR